MKNFPARMIYDDGLKILSDYVLVPKKNRGVEGFARSRCPIECVFGQAKGRFALLSVPRKVNVKNPNAVRKQGYLILACFFFQSLQFYYEQRTQEIPNPKITKRAAIWETFFST